MILLKNYAHHVKTITKLQTEIDKHIEFRKLCKKMRNEKMIAFFSDKTAKDFKNSKKFYHFYKTYINLPATKIRIFPTNFSFIF